MANSTSISTDSEGATATKTVDLKDLSAVPITTPIPEPLLTSSLATPPFIPIPGSLNLRDLGLLPNSRLKPGLLYRSGALTHIPPKDLARLPTNLGVRTIFDLRHASERRRAPEPEIPGVHSIWLEEDRAPTRLNPSDFVVDNGIPAFVAMYADELALHKEGYKRILQHLHDMPPDNGGILWHCTAGKDRAGLFAIMILSLTGHDAEMIGYDYALSRVGIEREKETLTMALEAWLGKGAMGVPGVREMGSTAPAIAEAVLRDVEGRWEDGFWGFCRVEMGFSEEELRRIVENVTRE